MINCSLQNKGILYVDWVQVRPSVTQHFGLNPSMYAQFGMEGHNGIDYRAVPGTPLFAPMDGVVKVKDSGVKGYGLHVKIRNEFKELECVIGHMSKLDVVNGQRVFQGDRIGLSGNTGFSTGPHIHEGFRRIILDEDKDIYSWKVADYNNGFFGYFDHLEFVINWKGTLLYNNL